MRFLAPLILISLCTLSAQTLNQGTTPQTLPLWTGDAPGALGNEDPDRPTLTIFLPWRDSVPTAVIVCPGGGYGGLADNHEGRQVANWLNSMGVAAFVLKYRLGPPYPPPGGFGDA